MVDDEPREPSEDTGSDEGEDVEGTPQARLLVEGLLFSAGKPLRIVDIEEATGLGRGVVRGVLRKLASDYRRRSTALEVTRVGDRWTMQVREELTAPVRAVAAPEVPSRLLRTLALIAYHQPVLQSDLQEMLGPKVYDHVRELEGLGLVSAARAGSTKRLTTTQRFPEYFGIRSAKREEIKRFLADRVGIQLAPEPTASPDGAGVEEEAPEATVEGTEVASGAAVDEPSDEAGEQVDVPPPPGPDA